MCLLLAWLNPNKRASLQSSILKAFPIHRYALIVASNRDERFDRPTLPSQFSNDAKGDILAGWDATPGKEGGTWLGMSLKRLKIGGLVNIPERSPTGSRGRGNLVVDFLKTPGSFEEYVKEKGLSGVEGEDYPGFQLVAFEGSKRTDEKTTSSTSPSAAYDIDWSLRYTSNKSSSFSAMTNSFSDSMPSTARDIFVFSNSPFDQPLMKVADVKARFRKDVLLAERRVTSEDEKIAQTHEKEEAALMEALFDILSCRREYDDKELDSRLIHANYKGALECSDEFILGALSSVFNKTPVFGTRTQTVLLVEWDGSAIWKEKTMREPIDPDNPIWDEKVFRVEFQNT